MFLMQSYIYPEILVKIGSCIPALELKTYDDKKKRNEFPSKIRVLGRTVNLKHVLESSDQTADILFSIGWATSPPSPPNGGLNKKNDVLREKQYNS